MKKQWKQLEKSRWNKAISTKFRCVRDSFIRGENTSRKYEYGTRPASWLKEKSCFFPNECRECARSAREISPALSTRITQGMHTRAPSRRLYELVPPHSALSTTVSNCSARFHLTHVALECRVGARIEKQRQVPTYARKTTICFLAEKFNAVLFSLKHTGIPCHEIAVQLQNAAGVQELRKIFIAKDNVRDLFLMQQPIVPVLFFSRGYF